jgi:hypothetical protein
VSDQAPGARAAGVLEARLLEIERLEPADCFGGGFVRHTEAQGDGAITQAKRSKAQRFSPNPLVGGQLGGFDQRHLKWQCPGGSNTLRPGPPIFSFNSSKLSA